MNCRPLCCLKHRTSVLSDQDSLTAAPPRVSGHVTPRPRGHPGGPGRVPHGGCSGQVLHSGSHPAKQSSKCITEPGRLPRDLTYAHGTGGAAPLRTHGEDTVEPSSPQREARAYLRPLRHAPSGLTDARLAHVTQLARERTGSGSGSGSVSRSAGPRPLPHPSQRTLIQRSNFSLYHGKLRFNFLNTNITIN